MPVANGNNMKTIIFLTLVALSTQSFALTRGGPSPKSYEITGKLFINGEKISESRIVTVEGQSSEISQITEDEPVHRLRMKILATEAEDPKVDGIMMKFEFSYSDTTKKVEATPQILAVPGQEASIAVGNVGQKPEYELKVMAIRLEKTSSTQ